MVGMGPWKRVIISHLATGASIQSWHRSSNQFFKMLSPDSASASREKNSVERLITTYIDVIVACYPIQIVFKLEKSLKYIMLGIKCH